VVIGICQSYKLLRKLRPDVIFVKGGFVGVPVGLAAAWLKIPYVTHDSDAIPGLANRIISRWAKIHAVALPKEVYQYPADKTITVGVPISHKFHPLTAAEKQALRKKLGLEKFKQIVFVTGGGLGAHRLNNAVAVCVSKLLRKYPDIAVVQLAGRKLETELRALYETLLSKTDRKHVFVEGFITNLHEYSGVADVVITRAGGTSIAEFAAQAKPCIVIPNPILAGGHQLKNAKVLEERHAVKVVSNTILQDNPEALLLPLFELLDHPEEAQKLSRHFSKIAQPDAAHRLAMVLLEQAQE
jgi:UDP-N-acetylglucosamine--N-acetylmuramyl-(pentapeptide) pyrophosphoryl-undecaprenol N-acetylglucosamine transferase